MANSVAVQTLQDGPRNAILKLTGVLDSSDEAYAIKIDPAALSSITTDNTTRATLLSIECLDINIEDGLTVTLWWDVDGTQTNAKRIEDLTGRAKPNYTYVGRLTNNAVSPTGKIALSTQGWGATLIQSYSIIIHVVKK